MPLPSDTFHNKLVACDQRDDADYDDDNEKGLSSHALIMMMPAEKAMKVLMPNWSPSPSSSSSSTESSSSSASNDHGPVAVWLHQAHCRLFLVRGLWRATRWRFSAWPPPSCLGREPPTLWLLRLVSAHPRMIGMERRGALPWTACRTPASSSWSTTERSGTLAGRKLRSPQRAELLTLPRRR